MTMVIKKTAKYIISLCLILFTGVSVISAATSNMNVSFTIRQPEHPLQPILYDMPTTEICETIMNVQGRAESNVEIYLNGHYQTVSSAEDGGFELTLYFEDGTNTFQIQAKRDDDFSEQNSYTVQNNMSCFESTSYVVGSTVSNSYLPKVTLEQVADHLGDLKADDYIQNTIHLVDESIEPLNAVTKLENNKANPFKNAVDLGVKHTYDDNDNDGISDVAEEVLGLNMYKKDSDNDGVPDINELAIGKTIDNPTYQLQVNLSENQNFDCNSLIIHGDLQNQSSEPIEDNNIEFCLSGKDKSQCFNISPDIDGEFATSLEPKIKDGQYNASFKINEELLSEFPVSCSTSKIVGKVQLSQIDFQKIYEEVDGRYVRKVKLYSVKPQPIVKGVSANHDLVFGFWMQDNKKIAQSIAFSDVNGEFETKPNKRLNSSFGFGRASLFVYGLNDGEFGQVDNIEFYIFDFFIIALEIIAIVLCLVTVSRIKNKLCPKKSKRRLI